MCKEWSDERDDLQRRVEKLLSGAVGGSERVVGRSLVWCVEVKGHG